MEIVKKGFALLCALALTLTLSPPHTQAADNLAPAAAVAFYVAACFWADNNIFVHAELRDMDGDGQPELAAVTIPKEDANDFNYFPTLFNGHCVVWKYVPGVGLQTVRTDVSTGANGDIVWAHKGGKFYLRAIYASMHGGIWRQTDIYLGSGGVEDSLAVYWDMNTLGEMASYDPSMEPIDWEDAHASRRLGGTEQAMSMAECDRLKKSYQTEGESLIETGDWWDGSAHNPNYAALESRLYDTVKSVSAAPSATWGPCRLDTEDDDTWIVFESVKAERKTVSVNEVETSVNQNGVAFTLKETGYQPQTATVLQARPGSHLVVCGEEDEIYKKCVFYKSGAVEGESRFRTFVSDFGMESFGSGAVRERLGRKERGLMSFLDRDGKDCILYAAPGGALDAYTDVNPAGYYAVPITWGIQRGITNGTTATTFSPDNTCTRAHILTFLWRACGSPQPSIDNPFTDVSASDYYYQPALWAAEKGLLQSGSKFNGGSPCARSEAATYLWKLSGDDDVEGATGFKDVKNGTETAKAVQWAVESGVTNGTTATTFSPDNTCTRAQIMAFLYRDYAIET